MRGWKRDLVVPVNNTLVHAAHLLWSLAHNCMSCSLHYNNDYIWCNMYLKHLLLGITIPTCCNIHQQTYVTKQLFVLIMQKLWCKISLIPQQLPTNVVVITLIFNNLVSWPKIYYVYKIYGKNMLSNPINAWVLNKQILEIEITRECSNIKC